MLCCVPFHVAVKSPLMSVLCNAKMVCRSCKKQMFKALKWNKMHGLSVNEVVREWSCQIKASFCWMFATDTSQTCKLASYGNVFSCED